MGKKLGIGLGLAAVLWLSLLPLSGGTATNLTLPQDVLTSQADSCHNGTITVYPAVPSPVDPVSIVISGWWGSSCPAVTYQHLMAGYNITFSITVTEVAVTPPVACLDVVTPWTITQELGTLVPGLYTVQANCSAGPCWSFEAKTTFRVWRPTAVQWQQYFPTVLREGMLAPELNCIRTDAQVLTILHSEVK